MTLAQTRNFVLTRLSLQRLKESRRNYLAGANYADPHYRRGRAIERQDGSWRCVWLNPDNVARGIVVP